MGATAGRPYGIQRGGLPWPFGMFRVGATGGRPQVGLQTLQTAVPND